MSIEIGDTINSSIMNLSAESALKDRRKEETKDCFREEVKMMKTACQGIDILNLKTGMFTNTVLAKIKICREILTINGEHLSDKKILALTNHLDRVEKIINKKIKYGEIIDKYLAKKDGDFIEKIKANLALQNDLDKYAKIQKRLLDFRNKLVNATDKILKHLPEKQE